MDIEETPKRKPRGSQAELTPNWAGLNLRVIASRSVSPNTQPNSVHKTLLAPSFPLWETRRQQLIKGAMQLLAAIGKQAISTCHHYWPGLKSISEKSKSASSTSSEKSISSSMSISNSSRSRSSISTSEVSFAVISSNRSESLNSLPSSSWKSS